jgi:hypothetical protein
MHEPDPRFVESLEGQLGRELRRNNRSATRPGIRALKMTGLVIGSVTLGAAAMGAAQQIQDSWRRELLEARLEVQLQMAQQRLNAQRDGLETTREQVELGVRNELDLVHFELQIAQSETDLNLRALDLDEVRQSGREPLDDLSAPRVDGRDFVSERLRLRLDLASRHLDVVMREADRSRDLVRQGLAGEQEAEARDLAMREAELQLDALHHQLDLRSEFLDSEISAVEAELKTLEVEARNRVVLLDQRLRFFQGELDNFQAAIDAGTVHPITAANLRTQAVEIEAQLQLAQQELMIVQRELERRAP